MSAWADSGVLWLSYWGGGEEVITTLRHWVWLALEKNVGSPLTMNLKGYENLHVSLQWFWMWLWWKLRGSWKSKMFYNQAIHGANPVGCLSDSILGFFPNTDCPIAWPHDWLWTEMLPAIFGLTPTSHHMLAGHSFSLQVDVEYATTGQTVDCGPEDSWLLVQEQTREVPFQALL